MDTIDIGHQHDENESAILPVTSAIEGFRHMLEQMDLLPVTRVDVISGLNAYLSRESLHQMVRERLEEAEVAIGNLLADGYPAEPTFEVNGDVLEDLDQNLDTLNVARARFKLRPVTVSGKLEAGEEHAPTQDS